MTVRAALCISLVAALAWSNTVSSQAIRGKVAVLDLGDAIERAAVFLRSEDGEVHGVALSDSLGLFALAAPGPGRYYLSIHRLGYEPTQSDLYELKEDLIVDVRVNMKQHAFALRGVTIYGRRMTWGQAEFEMRRERLNHEWFYHSFDTEEIQRRHASNVEDLVKYSLPYNIRLQTWCTIIWLDGWESPDFAWDYPIHWVYGVEVFRRPHDVPWKYRKYYPTCAAVLVWTTTVGGR